MNTDNEKGPLTMPALIVQHPKASMQFDPPTPESIAAAKAAMERERAAIGFAPLPDLDRYETLAATELVRELVDKFGADRVVRWVRFHSWMSGREEPR